MMRKKIAFFRQSRAFKLLREDLAIIRNVALSYFETCVGKVKCFWDFWIQPHSNSHKPTFHRLFIHRFTKLSKADSSHPLLVVWKSFLRVWRVLSRLWVRSGTFNILQSTSIMGFLRSNASKIKRQWNVKFKQKLITNFLPFFQVYVILYKKLNFQIEFVRYLSWY